MFHDYNTATHLQTPNKSLTTFWSLWSGLATPSQATQLVAHALPLFEEVGGAVSTLKQPSSAQSNDPELRQRQWDDPYGWAPHQIVLWEVLLKYNNHDIAERLAYKWLYLLTKIAVENDGMLTERYDLTKLDFGTGGEVVEYGNQGVDFKGVAMEGFGWTNASYTHGLTMIGDELKECLRKGMTWGDITKERGTTTNGYA
jgi:alpha,alpha-trehalase